MFEKGYKSWNTGTSKTKLRFICENCGTECEKYSFGRVKIRFCSNRCAHEKMPVTNKGKHLSDEHKKKLSLAKIGKKQTPTHVKNRLRRREISSLELKFRNIVDKLNLKLDYTGNGKIMIENINPDFVDVSKKLAIEVYYTDHKNKFRGGVDSWKKNRNEIFSRNGWSVLYFNELEVKEEHIKEMLVY